MHWFVGGKLSEAGIGKAQHLNSSLVIVFIQITYKVTAQHGSHLFHIGKKIWHVKNSVGRYEVNKVCRHACTDVNGTANNCFRKFGCIAQLPSGVNVNRNPSP